MLPPEVAAARPPGAQAAGAWEGCAVVVAAGGRARRMGGGDKLAADLDGRSVLGALLAAVPPTVPVVLVGPPRPVDRPVLLTRERPAGAGPAAAVAAGASALRAAARAGVLAPGAGRLVVVLAGDAPHAPTAVPSLVAALRASDGGTAAVAVDPGGRRQPLLAVHRADALAERLRAAGGDLAGRAASSLVQGPGVVEVPVGELVSADVDTPEDLERARARVRGRS